MPTGGVTTVADGPTWHPFAAEQIAQLEAEGKPYFIDFTAAWCLTCQVNKRVALSDRAVLQAFSERDITLFRADWTAQDPAITRALEGMGRSGVPVYVLHPGAPADDPLLLPELLTAGVVLDALQTVPAAPALSRR
jgi:thiol:disulfide interchange protein DsbD